MHIYSMHRIYNLLGRAAEFVVSRDVNNADTPTIFSLWFSSLLLIKVVFRKSRGNAVTCCSLSGCRPGQ